MKQLPPSGYQLSIFQMDDSQAREMKEFVRNIDINTLTPVEALLHLQELKKKLEK